MGSPANPISATTQKLEKGVSATADINGQASFVYPSPPAGVSWTGTLNCANAPLASVFNAVIGGTSWGSWGGNSVFGPIQILGQGSEQLTVSATGLTANTAYEVWLLGSSDQSVNLAPIWPDPTSSALTASIAGTAATLIQTGGVNLTGGATLYSGTVTQTFYGIGVYLSSTAGNFNVSVSIANGGNGQEQTIRTAVTETSQNITNPALLQGPGLIGPPGFGGGNNVNNNFLAPIIVTAGQTLVVSALSLPASVPVVCDVWVVGYSQLPVQYVENAPNTVLETRDAGGLLLAQIFAPNVNTTYQFLPAAANGYAYRLWRWGSLTYVGAANGSAWITDALGRIDNQTIVSNAVTNVLGGSLNGQLTSGPVNVIYNTSPAAPGFFLRYDIVPLPSFG
jgi:hypothetical protein